MVTVRDAVEADSRMLWEWRNDPVTRAQSLTVDEVPFDRHATWYAASLVSDTRRIYVGEEHDETIGMVRFDRDGTRATVSINLAPAARGRGLSRPLLTAGLDAFLAVEPAVEELVAEIRASNAASLRLFAGAGFAPREATDEVAVYVRRRAPGSPS